MKKIVHNVLQFLLMALLMSLTGQSIAANPLAAEKAFIINATFAQQNRLNINLDIAPGYFLYAKKTQITSEVAGSIKVDYPQGDLQYDKVRGRYEAFAGLVLIPVKLVAQTNNFKLKINYQGCSADGFCYPPQEKIFAVDVPAQTVQLVKPQTQIAHLLKDQNKIAKLLMTQHLGVVLGLFFAMGLLLAFTPCVLPMIPILASIVVGQHEKNSRHAFWLSLTYVLGAAVTYAAAGAIAAHLGSSLQVWLQRPVVIIATSLLFLLLALNLLELVHFRVLHRLQQFFHRLSNLPKGGSYLGVFGMGILSTLVVSPCVTAPLVGVLIYITQTGNVWLGAGALFVMGLGMGVPLLAIGLSADKWLPKSGAWMHTVKQLFGILMLAMAVWMVSRIASHTVVIWLSTGLLIIAALLIFRTIPHKLFKIRRSRQAIFIIAVLGILMAVALVSGLNMLRPTAVVQTDVPVIVRSQSQLEKALTDAKNAHQPALVDFYADWCESCKDMEEKVLQQSDIQILLKKFTVIRADLSANSADEEAMMRANQIIAPPTFLFFNSNGKPLPAETVVGETDAATFQSQLNRVLMQSSR